MRMLCWVSEHTIKYKIRNECIRGKLWVSAISEKMVESHLKWFCHMRRWPIEIASRRVDQMDNSSVIRDRGRSRKNLMKPLERI